MIEKTQKQPALFYKLIALWVVVEAFLGGIIHSFKLPISGLLIASGAVICLCLVAQYYNSKNAIIKATIIVAVFKAMLSPQAPPTAYIAVFFQGIVAQILFANKKYTALKCVVLAMLSLAESGVQKIIVVTVLYGTNFYKAVDEFAAKIFHNNNHSYSLWLALCYVIVHVLAGIYVGLFCAKLPYKIMQWKTKYKTFVVDESITNKEIEANTMNKKYSTILRAIIILIVFISVFYFTKTLISSSQILQIIYRTLAILFAWHFIVKPVIQYLLNIWLMKKKKAEQSTINQVLNILPTTLAIVKLSWQQAKQQVEESRLKLFVKLVIVNTI